MKIGAVIWVIRDVDLLKIDIFTDHIRDEPRNPLAFAHGGLNLVAAQMMSKPAQLFGGQADALRVKE